MGFAQITKSLSKDFRKKTIICEFRIYSQKLSKRIETDRMKIVPEYRKKEFLNFLKGGLEDVSISRPKKNLTWGIPVPGDPEQIMYVWIDALANYLTVIGYPDIPEWEDFWPANVQVIGKDILRFSCWNLASNATRPWIASA